jgi:multidrug efflux pump subunit AcrB
MSDTVKNKKTKEFKLSSLSIDNKNTVFILTIIILISGTLSYISMPRESFPEVVVPEIYIGTPYPGNSPLDIEKLITRPLEKEINSISGVDKITSTSIQGYSTIVVRFDFDITPDEALRKVKDKVDVAKADPDFPKDLPADPNVFELNISELMPIMNINLSGNFSLDQLKDYAEYLEDEIEDLPEISTVDIRGIQDKEVKILLDPYRMEATQISLYDVYTAVSDENMTISGGDLLIDGYKRSVRVIGEFTNMEQIRNIIVKQEGLDIVYLKDIADVEYTEADKESYAREFQNTVVMLDVMKRAGENLLSAAEQIEDILDDARENHFPENLEVSITSDQSDYTRTQVDELENSIVFGVILVVLVLLFFLGFRNSLFVGAAIPLSMLLSFMILSAAGITLNFMVLFALVMALGMLVDNGIVVVENIYRLMDQGMKPIQAAKEGVGEVAMPIIASTATTLAAFSPLAIWPGMMGEFMKFLPITLIIVLGSSLVVALVINPVLTSVFMRIKEQPIVYRRKLFIYSLIYISVGYVLQVIATHVLPNAPVPYEEVEPMVNFVNFISYIFLLIGVLRPVKNYAFVSEDSNRRIIFRPAITLVLISIVFFATGLIAAGNIVGIGGSFLIVNAYLLFPATIFFQRKIIPWLESRYEKTIRYALTGNRPYKFLFGTVIALILSFILVGASIGSGRLKVAFFPDNQPQYVNIFIENPIGTDIEVTNEFTKELEQKVLDYLKKYEVKDPETGEVYNFLVTSVIAQVGEGTSDPNQGFVGGNTPHKARINVSFVKFQERRGVMTADVLTDIRNLIGNYPGVNIVISKDAAGPPSGPPINIEVAGDDYYQLIEEAESIKQFLNESNIVGVEELKLDVEQGKPEITIEVDRDKARRFNLSTRSIGDAIRTAVFGLEVSNFKDGEDEYDIVLRFKDDYRYDLNTIMNQKITFRDAATGAIRQVPISAVASPVKTSTFSAVKRRDLDRLITVYSNILEGANANEVVATMKSSLENYELPEGITIKFTGEQEDQAKEMAFLGTALIIAVFLVFLIIVAQFNSYVTPLIIIITVLFSLIGVLLGLAIFGMDFIVIMTMIGIISLAGVVVNNAIVLLDYTKLTIKRRRIDLGIAADDVLPINEIYEAMVQGGKTRLRPVLLTAITTVLGLVPLAVGLNINFVNWFTSFDPKFYLGGDNVMFWGPISWTIIFGLTFATFLTLVIVPVMYYLVNIYRVKKALKKKEMLLK